eukprot:gnl/Carplike_NY0171/4534_a6168_196.p2 GENE.gnl/Carplike_NY0171/4534_a6168_196~~gnl/Carplike_NY0171/4534_a6168_196.p2  ORF type:complete len:135 (-),score=49.35 gnl/Carplike_NY0171/4534_a6168_196:860-1264(-)
MCQRDLHLGEWKIRASPLSKALRGVLEHRFKVLLGEVLEEDVTTEEGEQATKTAQEDHEQEEHEQEEHGQEEHEQASEKSWCESFIGETKQAISSAVQHVSTAISEHPDAVRNSLIGLGICGALLAMFARKRKK